ncbi:MAG: replication initiator protein A [Verrucomicrobiales bacterium]|nr:replication initiator protein A [Verrucomicrobiales bacterium]
MTLPKVAEGKDELNLAEFPLSAIADRLDPTQKTMTFEDRIWDGNRGEMVTRQLTITASDQHGLPTALDDEVILGLVQLSKLQKFSDRRVSFSRYQLIQLLGWRHETKSYERLEKSLNRWVGVTLYYQNAWWSKDDQCWVNEKFHILDNVSLFTKDDTPKRSRNQAKLPLSTFVWNDVLFRSFRAGNLKSIDFDFFRSLRSAVAKRLYRFLDKRFFHRDRWEFNLKEVSWEHIGLSRRYDTANLKRKLRPPIRELEERGFLQPLPEELRFAKVRSGDWRVIFERVRPVEKPPEQNALTQALVQRGVTPVTACEVVGAYPSDQIEARLEVFDWLQAKKDPKVTRNPAGFLVASIRTDYSPPKGFVSREERDRQNEIRIKGRQKAEERELAARAREEAKVREKDAEIEKFWNSLSETERSRAQGEALARAKPFERELVGKGGTLGKVALKAILEAYALKLMGVGV